MGNNKNKANKTTAPVTTESTAPVTAPAEENVAGGSENTDEKSEESATDERIAFLNSELESLAKENADLKEAAEKAGTSEEVEGLKAEIISLKKQLKETPKSVIEDKKDLDKKKAYVSGPNGKGYVEA